MAEGETQSALQPPEEARSKAATGLGAAEPRRPVLPRPVGMGKMPAAEPLPPPQPAIAAQPAPAPWPEAGLPEAGLSTAAFRSDDPEMRLRDLLAFALAAEALGNAPGTTPDIAALRQRADGELNAHAFRLLHNRVEEIRREAKQEQISAMRPTLSFGTLVVANAVALAAVGLIGLVVWGMTAAMGGR